MIHCDTKSYQLLHDRFEFGEPIVLNLKGIGEMQVYRLIGRKPA